MSFTRLGVAHLSHTGRPSIYPELLIRMLLVGYCLGIRSERRLSEGLTPPAWVEALTEHFRQHGYEVGHNTPYVGVIDAGAKAAVMIEIRRDVVGAPSGDPKWQRLIAALSTMPIGV